MDHPVDNVNLKFLGATTHSSSLTVTEEEDEENTEGGSRKSQMISGKGKERRARFGGSGGSNKNESVV